MFKQNKVQTHSRHHLKVQYKSNTLTPAGHRPSVQHNVNKPHNPSPATKKKKRGAAGCGPPCLLDEKVEKAAEQRVLVAKQLGGLEEELDALVLEKGCGDFSEQTKKRRPLWVNHNIKSINHSIKSINQSINQTNNQTRKGRVEGGCPRRECVGE